MSILQSIIDEIFGSSPKPSRNSLTAIDVMRRLNPNALHFPDSDRDIFIEDVADTPTDGRLFRIEYQVSFDAKKALAYVRSNPWDLERPGAGWSYADCHVSPKSGSICIGKNHTEDLTSSAYDLECVVKRARYWCTVFSAWQERNCATPFNDIAMGRGRA